MLLPIAYFPPVEYFALLLKSGRGEDSVYIDGGGNYQKQSYRNRCRILSSQGPLDLNFPIVHNGEKSIRRVLVDYSTPWIAKTKTAISSAYWSSPFFEYYKDELFAILESKPETLWELDWRITEFFCRKIGIPVPEIVEGELRSEDPIHPKKTPVLRNREYWQVFKEKYGFTPNLSIMDLLFNEGPESICYL